MPAIETVCIQDPDDKKGHIVVNADEVPDGAKVIEPPAPKADEDEKADKG